MASLVGCSAIDTDPADDYRAASALVAQRSDWEPNWNAPWADDGTSWDGSTPLTSTEAVTIALQNNRRLRVDLEGIAAARADLAQSGLLPNPVLSASLGKNQVGTVSALGLVQELTRIWLLPAQRDAAAEELRAQVQTVSDHALRLVADVRSAHARVVFGQRSVSLAESQLELVGRALSIAQDRLDAGAGTQLDVNRLSGAMLSVQSDLERQRLALLIKKTDLLGLLGMAAADVDWQAAEDAQLWSAGWASLTESDAVERASKLRLDVQAARSAVEVQRHELRVASLGQIPAAAIQVDYEKDQDALRTPAVGLDLEIPVFDTRQASLAKAASDLRAAAAAADQVLQVAIQQTRSGYLALQANLRLMRVFRDDVVSLAQANLDAAQRAYDAGELALAVVLDAQRELIDSQSELNDLQLDVATSAVELEYVVGGKL